MKRSKFSLSHYKLLTCDMGALIPLTWFEALPGDTIQQATSLLVRVSPLLAPVMHPVRVRIHHWFVPNRLLWDDWEDFITGGPDGMDETVFPHFPAGTIAEKSLADYMGMPPPSAPSLYSALPFRAYAMIFNEFYRDQDLVPEVPISTASDVDNTTSRVILNAAWEKDYYTSARPWTQKGPDVSIPIGLSAPVIPAGDGSPLFDFGTATDQHIQAATDGQLSSNPGAPTTAAWGVWADPKLQADLTNVSAVNINELRTAFALQRYEEARARYGSRYTEYLRYLGVKSSDARLQRPEYLGGGKQTIQFSEVLQTGPDTSDAGVANLKGHGIGAVRSNRYRRFFEEHGIVMSIMSVLPKTMYAQATERKWRRFTKESYFQRELQHVGQQAILNGEVFNLHTEPAEIFGYQDRYDEYRRMESSIAGEFRSTLDFWHYARLFESSPALNEDFVKATPTKRVNAVQTEDVLWVMANHSIQARRQVAKTGRSFIF